jgi:hypothetical protein
MTLEEINEDRRASNIIAAISMAVAGAAITIIVILSLLELKPWQLPPQQSEIIYFHGMYANDAPEGWWNPRSDSWEDNWQIGGRIYRTKDLMGRRI